MKPIATDFGFAFLIILLQSAGAVPWTVNYRAACHEQWLIYCPAVDCEVSTALPGTVKSPLLCRGQLSRSVMFQPVPGFFSQPDPSRSKQLRN